MGKVTDITIDGKMGDWDDYGLQINILNPLGGDMPAHRDFYPRCRLGWDERGILLLAMVEDDTFTEADSQSDIWRKDAIEFFMADKVGGNQRLQLLIAPGMDTKHAQPRYHLNNLSPNKPNDNKQHQPVIARTKQDNGYFLEALIPWQILKLDPLKNKGHQELALQIFFNDVDGDSVRKQLLWYPGVRTYSDSTQMHPIRIAGGKTSPNTINATASASIQYLKWLKVNVLATPELAGRTCRLMIPNQPAIKQTLQLHGDWATCTFKQPLDAVNNQQKQVRILFGDNNLPSILDIPSLADKRKEMLLTTGLKFEPSTIFKTITFPECHFAQPLVMEQLLGSYSIKTDYYDTHCNPVSTAITPGRYGAVINITCHETGKTHTRYRTLYRMPQNVDPWDMTFGGDIQLPEAYGINPQVVKDHQKTVNAFVNWSFWDIAQNASFNAGLLSSLSQMEPGVEATVYNGVQTLEKQYWTTLERKLNHNDSMFTRAFALPLESDTHATTVHTGSMSEAGMTDDAPQKIDNLLSQWAEDTDEPFIACVIRNGVIVHHKAYGKRDDAPMQTNTKSWMASLSKLISGTMVMMMVDQQLINLDTPIDRYLPQLQNAGFNQMPTIRNLWTHTAGFTSHRGEDDPDLEHLIASIAPYVKVGNKYEYDGMGLELGIQLLGQVSGNCYPLMVKNHLLDPLGCTDTDCQNASWNTQSTAMDMAKIGQMLLNGGSYGPYRFMSKETRDAMLPIDMATLTGGRSTNQYGIGTSWYTGDGLSDRCFAHGAASSATLRIDLKHNLVISMTRNTAGKNFGNYHPKFIQTVTGCMLENQRVER
ncbi:MAG: serine hydrolase [Phycisphaeraceae bacterium JB051]